MPLLIFISFLCWLISMLLTLSSYSATNKNINFWASTKEYFTKFPQYIIISLLGLVLLLVLANTGLLTYVTQNALGLDNLKQFLPENTYLDVTYRIDVISMMFLSFNTETVINYFRRKKQPAQVIENEA